MGSDQRKGVTTQTVEEFIARWQGREGGQEHANDTMFLTEVRTAAVTQKAGVDPFLPLKFGPTMVRVAPGHEVAALQPAARGASGEAGDNSRSGEVEMTV